MLLLTLRRSVGVILSVLRKRADGLRIYNCFMHVPSQQREFEILVITAKLYDDRPILSINGKLKDDKIHQLKVAQLYNFTLNCPLNTKRSDLRRQFFATRLKMIYPARNGALNVKPALCISWNIASGGDQ